MSARATMVRIVAWMIFGALAAGFLHLVWTVPMISDHGPPILYRLLCTACVVYIVGVFVLHGARRKP